MKLYLHFSRIAKFLASIIVIIAFELTCSFLAFSSPVTFEDGLSRQLSFSKQVGSIQGGFSVNPIGAAHYSIPFQMPPGINGLVPNLGISYNSNAGNGLLGWGWDLSGIMSISRGPTSRLQEGYINQVKQLSTDRFFLNGSRLILISGTYGVYGSEYR